MAPAAKRTARAKAAPPGSTIKIAFEGAVLAVHVWINGAEAPLAANGNKWSGSCNVADGQTSIAVRLNFTAPSFTDWTLVVKRGAKKLVDDGDTSQTANVNKSWPAVTLA
jgi:hypothetical protein